MRAASPDAIRSAAPRLMAWGRRIASLAFLGAGIWLVWRQLEGMSWSGFVAALLATAPLAVTASILLTLCSYACLAGTEWLSLRALGHALPYRAALAVAAPAYALTNSAGFSPATGTVFRMHAYAARGLPVRAGAGVAMVAGAAVTLSGLVTAGLLMMLDPGSVAAAVRGPPWTAAALGAVLLAPAALWFLAFTPRAPRWLGGQRPAVPALRLRLAGLGFGVGDWLFSSAALFVLSPDPQLAVLPGFLVAYIAGSLLSAASGVPGGVGVFEAVVLSLTALISQAHETAAALLLYRCIYSLGPLAVWGLARLLRRRRRT